ncbi:MAG: alpha/beta fold hydrolase [Metamycoplasmataceae bacterium]
MEILKNKVGFYKFKPAVKKSKGTIVFIHGFATNSDYHDEAGKSFLNYDYYAIELPGHGHTKIDDDKNLDLNLFVDFAINMINELKLNNFVLIGHSMGGSLAIRISNKIGDKISKLILVTPMNSAFTLSTIKLFFLFTPKSFNKTLALNNVLYKDLTKTLNFNVENYISNEHKYQVEHLDFFRRLKNKLYSVKNISDCMKSEKLLSLPTLLIVGEYDKTIPYKSAIRAIKKVNRPYIQVSIFRESAHIPFKEEQEKYVKEILDFIE